MKVYKFGGASVNDTKGIRNLKDIVSKEIQDLVIVVSAFGKTTNALEKVLTLWFAGDRSYKDHIYNIFKLHSEMIGELFPSDNTAKNKIDDSFSKLKEYLSTAEKTSYDFEYDQVVSYGEIWSTIVVAAFLQSSGLKAEWIDIRKCLKTDYRHRDAEILWNESTSKIRSVFNFRETGMYVTQGFIGSTMDGQTTTLGREGSDYTAALLANMLDAESVVVWKDVPGLLNADPKWLSNASMLEEVSYREAVEMTFSGAKVIHPKTIKPLHNKNIPLYVKSFAAPTKKGTVIKSEIAVRHGLPVFIKKENQIMVSIVPKDFSFAMGENLSNIFNLFVQNGIKVNIVEASAISIDVCIDDDRMKVESLLNDLKTEFSATYNENVEMLSIRHYTPEAVERITGGRDILLEQRTRSSVRFVVRKV